MGIGIPIPMLGFCRFLWKGCQCSKKARPGRPQTGQRANPREGSRFPEGKLASWGPGSTLAAVLGVQRANPREGSRFRDPPRREGPGGHVVIDVSLGPYLPTR